MERADVLAQLASALPPDALIVDPDITRSLGHDEAEWAPVGEALGLIRATSSDQVATTVRICAQFGVAVTARGAGTGLSGGANAIDGGVIIALDRLNQIRLIDPLERLAVVQAGVINDVLRTAAAQYGLWYPPDPASSPWSTIGGNIATNAGGVCCVKYGVTKDYVLALEVVTGTGELVRLGRVTAKGVAGYDLVGLLVGSEGTLGIVTEATVRLKPLPAPPRTIVGYFSSIVDAGEAARAVAEAGIIPSALELVDRHCLAAVDKWKNMGLSVEADVVLLVGSEVGSGDHFNLTKLEISGDIIRIDIDPGELTSVYSAVVPIQSDARAAMLALSLALSRRTPLSAQRSVTR